MPKNVTLKDIRAMTVEELENHEIEVGNSIAGIRAQLDAAKSLAADTGQYSDRKWYNAANFALRRYGQTLSLIQRELGRKRRMTRHSTVVERNFVSIAERRLHPEVFDEMLKEAKEVSSIKS